MSVSRAGRLVAAALLVPAVVAACGSSDDGGVASSSASSAPTGPATSAPSADEPTDEPELVAVSEVEPGDCFQDPSDDLLEGGLGELPVVPCEEPHDNEVYAVEALRDGAFPGPDELPALVEEACLGAFEPYVGVPFDASGYEVLPLPPSEESWAAGDREVLCTLFLPEDRPVGSARGSSR